MSLSECSCCLDVNDTACAASAAPLGEDACTWQLLIQGLLQAVIVAPSRELAMQIVRVGHALLPHEARGCIQQCIGGANPYRQVWPPLA